MMNKIKNFSDHFIICGYGRMGAVIAVPRTVIPFVQWICHSQKRWPVTSKWAKKESLKQTILTFLLLSLIVKTVLKSSRPYPWSANQAEVIEILILCYWIFYYSFGKNC